MLVTRAKEINLCADRRDVIDVQKMKPLLNDQGKTEILTRLRGLQPDSPRQWGKMNAHQAVCHLSDSFRLVMGERESADRSNFLTRTLVKWLALQAPIQWARGVKTGESVDQMKGGTRPVEFAQDRQELERVMERFMKAPRSVAHPFFGTMSEAEWLRWGWLHLDHHLRQFGQ
jgi:hypothetical protein